MTLTDRTWLGQILSAEFTCLNITETSACQSFYVGKFNNSLQLTKSALSALYNFIPLIFNRKFMLFKNINHTNCSLFLGQAALTACLLVLVN